MSKYLKLGKFSFGMGDRFGHQGKAQLRACILATELGAEVVPVWNKSNREHTFIGTEPSSLRAEADAAVKALGWKKPYHVDADHIRLETVDRFIAPSDFFTIDVADSIGKPADAKSVKARLKDIGNDKSIEAGIEKEGKKIIGGGAKPVWLDNSREQR